MALLPQDLKRCEVIFFQSFLTVLVLWVLSIRKRQEESKTVTWQDKFMSCAKELSLLITNGLFPIFLFLVSSCLSPMVPPAAPPHHEAALRCPAGCSVPVPSLPAGSSCWASRCLSDLWKPPPGPQPPWPGARSCCHHQTHRKGGTFPARRTAQLCTRWGSQEGLSQRQELAPHSASSRAAFPRDNFVWIVLSTYKMSPDAGMGW